MKHMISARSVCPHYKHEDSQMIYCDGVQDGSVVHLAFASKTDAVGYKVSHCRCKDYKQCKIYQMLEENNDDGME